MFRWMALFAVILVAAGCGSSGLATPGSGGGVSSAPGSRGNTARIASATGVEVNLSCSDGIQNTQTNLSVDLQTLDELKSSIEAMTLYPAGLTCSLTLAGLPGTSLVVAQASGGPRDFAVGGGHLTPDSDDCINFGLSAHGEADDGVPEGTESRTQVNGSTHVNGSLVVHVENCATGQPEDSHFKSRVICLSVAANEANGVARIEQARGSATACNGGPCTHVLWSATDNGNPSSGTPPDMLGYELVFSVVDPTCPTATTEFEVAKGNITIRDN